MARVQLVMADDDRDRFVHQARQEGMSLSAWLREAARERLEKRQMVKLVPVPGGSRGILRGHALRWKVRRRSRTGMSTCAS